MITNKDRSKWFGASDTSTIMGNWDTDTFAKWWLVKLGVITNDYTNKYMEFGNLAEHRIIDTYDSRIRKGKRPIYLPNYRIRVNLDGLTRRYVVEVKTTSKPMRKLPLKYWQQCQVEMLAARKNRALVIVYETIPDEYDRPYYLDVERDRIKTFWVERDDAFLARYLQRVKYLKTCMRRRVFPEAFIEVAA